MRTLFAAFACCMLVASVGCNKNKSTDQHHMSSSSQQMASMDVCPHCAGVQHGTADGKCEICGRPVSMPAGK